MGAQDYPSDGATLDHGKKVGGPPMDHRWECDGPSMAHGWAAVASQLGYAKNFFNSICNSESCSVIL